MIYGRCDPNKPASTEQLRKLGVLQWQLDADNHEKDPKLKAIRADRNYSYQVIFHGTVSENSSLRRTLPSGALTTGTRLQDVITIRKDTLPNYEEKLKSFFEEHLHTDEEIRYILEGSGTVLFESLLALLTANQSAPYMKRLALLCAHRLF